MSILIVDDDPDNVFLVQKMLEKADYKDLQSTSNAPDAFALLGLGRNEPSLKGIELILMDVMMPEIDGIKACQQIKQDPNLKDIPVVMMTALTEAEYLRAAFEAGAHDYVTKPLRPLELLARLHAALRLKREMDTRKKREEELCLRNRELEKAFNEIKTLRNFLPICSYCKKIRDVQGLWQQMESYLSQHTDLIFSHSVCEPCLHAHFPDLVEKKKGKES